MIADVGIIGGSVSGLIAAREAASRGLSVQVFEDNREIGVPEKCDGLVSAKGIAELGLVPPSSVVQNTLSEAVFFSPGGSELRIDARKQGVIVLDRNRFDKFLAELAAAKGAKIEVGCRIQNPRQDSGRVEVAVGSSSSSFKFLLDCSGYESYIRSGGKTLPAAQYLVYGRWFSKSTVEVYLDPAISPGLFTWVIPITSDIAKIGIAGEGINTFSSLDLFVRKKDAVVIRKMAAPIACFGPLKSFVEGRLVKAGDAAGQAKPTTGGGIYTGGYGGMLAGRACAKALASDTAASVLSGEYEDKWRSKFGREFKLQLRFRNAFAKLSRDQVERLFELISSSDLAKNIGAEGDFDMHSISIAKALGVSKVASILGILVANEMKSMLGIA